MSGEEERLSTYAEFRDNVLPRIAKQGYTVIQLMAIQEHAYYASFGYHVTNPFAVSSRCGRPSGGVCGCLHYLRFLSVWALQMRMFVVVFTCVLSYLLVTLLYVSLYPPFRTTFPPLSPLLAGSCLASSSALDLLSCLCSLGVDLRKVVIFFTSD